MKIGNNEISEKIVLFWFRRDLRLHDNAALSAALQSGYKVLPIFIFDTQILDKLENKFDTRVDLIHQVISNISVELATFGSSIKVLHGKPKDVFTTLQSKLSIIAVYTNNDYEPYALERDKEISELLEQKSISFKSYKDHVIFEPHEILKPDNKPYTIYTPYAKKWMLQLKSQQVAQFNIEQYSLNFVKTISFEIPSLQDLGFSKTNYTYKKPALLSSIITNYHETRNFPAIVGTSRMSEHLRFGTISTRECVNFAIMHNQTWLGELIWREFFISILFHFPYAAIQSFKKQYQFIPWINNENDFNAWCNGKTGYPMVDAGMRELNATGFMHNRVRMVVASFLCKHLLINWQWGEAYFAEKLIDFELSSNNGNWQWAASTGCDAVPYFRIFNPSEQIKRFDPNYEYILKWIPELETSKYPQPIVEHSFARNRVLEVFKKTLGNKDYI